nr:MAG TPA: hypothetical protein [Caudoviricetes sp.]
MFFIKTSIVLYLLVLKLTFKFLYFLNIDFLPIFVMSFTSKLELNFCPIHPPLKYISFLSIIFYLSFIVFFCFSFYV